MRIEIRSCATVSILLASLLCSCGKKEESPPAATPAAQGTPPVAKPQAEPAPAVQPPAPQAKEQPVPAAPAKTPETTAATTEKSFSGTIGGQPVLMQLSLKDVGGASAVTGSYFLEAQGSSNKIPLSGTLQDGSLMLEQKVQGSVTGTFELTNDSAKKNSYLGSWKGLGRVLPVKLTAAQ